MSGPNNSAQRAAQRQEQERQAAITRTSQGIEDIFSSPERQQQYADFENATRTLGMQDLAEQKRQADLGNKFALARSGLTGGSRARDLGTATGEDYTKGLLTVSQRAQAASADLMSADQTAKNNLLALAQSGLDLTTASQNAASAMRANLQAGEGSRLAGGIGDVFGTAAAVKQASDEARIRRQAEQQYGQSNYSPFYSYGAKG